MERGRSLSELGRSMTWSDLRAFILHLPVTSHFWRKEEPERARQSAWVESLAAPHTIVLCQLYDLLETDLLLRAGQQPSEVGIVQRLAGRVQGEVRQSGVREPGEKKRRRSAAEIRAQLDRAQKQR